MDRTREPTALSGALDGSRLVTVVGVGGIGKSSLVSHAAAALQNRYADARRRRCSRGRPRRSGGSVGPALFGSRHFGAPRELCQEQAMALLGAERYESCVREGAGLGVDAAVRRALAAPEPQRPRPVEPQRVQPPETRKPAGSPAGDGGGAAG
ncbi:hypothetical protein AB0903_02710 [Streptomyces sp. NPDC048389]|uniref:hypothetical protein n=1 Tax=Streptomyces sp. NPDC048389 TaxID=3154622 RepID=UPI00345508FA